MLHLKFLLLAACAAQVASGYKLEKKEVEKEPDELSNMVLDEVVEEAEAFVEEVKRERAEEKVAKKKAIKGDGGKASAEKEVVTKIVKKRPVVGEISGETELDELDKAALTVEGEEEEEEEDVNSKPISRLFMALGDFLDDMGDAVTDIVDEGIAIAKEVRVAPEMKDVQENVRDLVENSGSLLKKVIQIKRKAKDRLLERLGIKKGEQVVEITPHDAGDEDVERAEEEDLEEDVEEGEEEEEGNLDDVVPRRVTQDENESDSDIRS